jgi:hypothetical protein
MKVKLSSDSLTFLCDWVSQFKPYEVSDDSLVDLSVRIVRQLQLCGQLDLSPAGLQKLFSAKGGQT